MTVDRRASGKDRGACVVGSDEPPASHGEDHDAYVNSLTQARACAQQGGQVELVAPPRVTSPTSLSNSSMWQVEHTDPVGSDGHEEEEEKEEQGQAVLGLEPSNDLFSDANDDGNGEEALPSILGGSTNPKCVPRLMDELDAELLGIIRAYYQRKQLGLDAAAVAAASPLPRAGLLQPVSDERLGLRLEHAEKWNGGSGAVGGSGLPPATAVLAAQTTPPAARGGGASAPPESLPAPHLYMEHANRGYSVQHPFGTAAAATAIATAVHSASTASGNDHISRLTFTDFPSHSSTSFVRAYVSDTNLSIGPAVMVSGLTALGNLLAVYFLQKHVLSTRDHLGLFLIGSYLIFSSYYMVYYFLERSSSSFRRIISRDKKFYVIGNLLKAGILVSITPFAFYHLTQMLLFDRWQNNILYNLGCIYAMPDFVSMIVVRRMRWSTWVHHLCVVVFNYFSILNDYHNENICRCVVVYAAFSSFGYCVNVLLASRFLGVSAAVAFILSFVALVVYALCCAINWAWQVYYLHRLLSNGHAHWTTYTYMFLICLVVWDDVVLNCWLLHHVMNMSYTASQKLQQQQSPHWKWRRKGKAEDVGRRR